MSFLITGFDSSPAVYERSDPQLGCPSVPVRGSFRTDAVFFDCRPQFGGLGIGEDKLCVYFR